MTCLRYAAAFRPLACASLVLLSACQARFPPSQLAQEWADTLQTYDINPVFPPRAINVGDVFIVLEPPPGSKDPDSDYEYVSRGFKITQVDVRSQLSAAYRDNIQLPSPSNGNPTADIFTSPAKITNLPSTAFIGFNFVNVREGSLANFTPLRGLAEILGVVSTARPMMSISILQAEDLELPAMDAYDAWMNFCSSEQSKGVCYSNSARFQFFKNQIMEQTDSPDVVPRLFFVTHVYYASSIKYSYTTTGKYGVAIAGQPAPAAAPAANNKGSLQPTATATINMTTPGGGSGSTADVQAVQARLANLEKQVSTLAGGGTTTSTTITRDSASLTQTFQTPVAIGYRGFWITPTTASSLPPGE